MENPILWKAFKARRERIEGEGPHAPVDAHPHLTPAAGASHPETALKWVRERFQLNQVCVYFELK